ncbi:hypothetical protein WG908_15975 [Sphingobium sp. AN641]|uniref:hypothetical protein n=1 Tax=Sphingobium sp. AN641 TaxID=3133443 RepID=UPI0030BDF177
MGIGAPFDQSFAFKLPYPAQLSLKNEIGIFPLEHGLEKSKILATEKSTADGLSKPTRFGSAAHIMGGSFCQMPPSEHQRRTSRRCVG